MYRICESSRASSFLAAVNFFQDIVFNRICDLQDPCSVFKADIYYHNECMTKYMYEYDPRCKDTTPKLTPTQCAWYHGYQVVPELEQRLTNEKGYELSCIRHYLNNVDYQCQFRNRDVKMFLINHFVSNISFAIPNKKMMVFNISNNAASSLAESIRSVDPIQVCASEIRTALDNYDFGLENSCCDAEYLKIACNNMNITDTILLFFAYFL